MGKIPARDDAEAGAQGLEQDCHRIRHDQNPQAAGMFAFAGPAYLVSVGYMDPGNWATDLEGGARFGYQLLWVLVMSNAMAILLQTLSARLGIVSGRDLAQACRETYPAPADLAAVGALRDRHRRLRPGRGARRGHRPQPAVPHPAAHRRPDHRRRYAAAALVPELRHPDHRSLHPVADLRHRRLLLHRDLLAKPAISEIVTGLVPRLNRDSLYVAIGILGATVMPHNLYLHSALVQTRRIGQTKPPSAPPAATT